MYDADGPEGCQIEVGVNYDILLAVHGGNSGVVHRRHISMATLVQNRSCQQHSRGYDQARAARPLGGLIEDYVRPRSATFSSIGKRATRRRPSVSSTTALAPDSLTPISTLIHTICADRRITPFRRDTSGAPRNPPY